MDLPPREEGGEGGDVVMGVGSIEEGVRRLVEMGREREDGEGSFGGGREGAVVLGRVFVIGGAEIYAGALGLENCRRVLWTRVGGEWECDTFFPGGVLPVGGEEGERGWVRRSEEDLERWVGEVEVGGVKREGDVEFEVCMLEREEV